MINSIMVVALVKFGTALRSMSLAPDERGVTAIEYAIIAGILVIAIIISVPTIGKNLLPIFNNVATTL